MEYKHFIKRNMQKSIKVINFELKKIQYSGKKVECPFCSWKGRRFLPYGQNKRLNAQCLKCGSLERYRHLLNYLKSKTNFFRENNKVLEIAPIRCFQDMCKNLDNIEYVSIDRNTKLAMLGMNITNLSFKNNFFDYIICLHVLEHVNEDTKAIKELYRVLKPNGKAIIQVPIRNGNTLEILGLLPKLYTKYYGQKDHVRYYGRDIKKIFEDAGFEVKFDDLDDVGNDIINRFGLLKNEKLQICRKIKFNN